MDQTSPTMHNLFAQLGLPSEESDVQDFIETHRPIDSQLSLSEAPFWTESQARFLREQIIQDDDWAPVIDSLNTSLR